MYLFLFYDVVGGDVFVLGGCFGDGHVLDIEQLVCDVEQFVAHAWEREVAPYFLSIDVEELATY